MLLVHLGISNCIVATNVGKEIGRVWVRVDPVCTRPGASGTFSLLQVIMTPEESVVIGPTGRALQLHSSLAPDRGFITLHGLRECANANVRSSMSKHFSAESRKQSVAGADKGSSCSKAAYAGELLLFSPRHARMFCPIFPSTIPSLHKTCNQLSGYSEGTQHLGSLAVTSAH